MSRSIQLLTDQSLFDAGNRFEPTVANFPGLKHRFSCNELTDTASLTDDVGGLSVAITAITNNGDGTITFPGTGTALAGTIAAIPAGHGVLAVLTAKPPAAAANIMTLGDSNGQPTANTESGFRAMSAIATGTAMVAQAGVLTAPATTGVGTDGNGTLFTSVSAFRPNNSNGVSYSTMLGAHTGAVTQEATSGNTAAAGMINFSVDQKIFIVGSSRAYQLMWFYLSAANMPNDEELRGICAWQQWAASLGKKWICPTLAGRV